MTASCEDLSKQLGMGSVQLGGAAQEALEVGGLDVLVSKSRDERNHLAFILSLDRRHGELNPAVVI